MRVFGDSRRVQVVTAIEEVLFSDNCTDWILSEKVAKILV
jgi:hypothetical protein